MKTLGFDVEVNFNDGNTVTFHNVTEIHYAYDGGASVAFESDIHGTGSTWLIASIKEFEARLAVKLSPSYQ